MRANTAEKKHPELTKTAFAKFLCNNFAKLPFSSKILNDGSRYVNTFFRKNPKRARLKKIFQDYRFVKDIPGD